MDPTFTILDIETTGFSPKHGDKIVEIALISVDMAGNILDTYESLINPDRDVTASHIHGITAEMVRDAPKIEDVMDEILVRINNKTIVGHNVDFDLRFINHEIQKKLHLDLNLKGLCTLQLSRLVVPGVPTRKLDILCNYFGIENSASHSAYGDCYSTMQLFIFLKSALFHTISPAEFSGRYHYPVKIPLSIQPKNIAYKRSDAAVSKQREFDRLAQMIHRLPSNPNDSFPVQSYLNILDDILSDRVITKQEFDKLQDFITEMEISKEQVMDIHSEYVRKLARVYLLDNILSDSEYRDLHHVCELLCVENKQLDKIVEFEKAKIAEQKTSCDDLKTARSNYLGKSVCFTGQLTSRINGCPIERIQAHQIAMEHGLIIKSGVSNNLDYLVVADPNTLSGKAKKAREIGISIIAEPVFWNMIGLTVE